MTKSHFCYKVAKDKTYLPKFNYMGIEEHLDGEPIDDMLG